MLKFPANTTFINLTSGYVAHGYHINCYSEAGKFLGTVSKKRTLGELQALFAKGRTIRIKQGQDWARIFESYSVNDQMVAKSGILVRDPFDKYIVDAMCNKLKG